ncbi:hypothetical protein HS088_TW04G01549 [Tripterygium wilfordii]|uniref:F-box domain-containing protein n=1 Tax=Tripterygium wilfordii TaxID=458696 RepID=A0A7J7DTH0_TRIWF|nr:hypothetical protein HS088_TW04G01549 [Tripterygium wilfordii]
MVRSCINSRKKKKSSCSLNSLTDDLLIEVLHRLSSGKLIYQCKTVCKRWCSLLSSPDFLRRTPIPSTVILNPYADYGQILLLDSDFGASISDPAQSFKFLTSCHDLLLVSPKEGDYRGTCCILNPFTMDFLPLPRMWSSVAVFGFVFEPYDYCCPPNTRYRFRVVRFPQFGYSTYQSNFEFQLYSSETNEWTNGCEMPMMLHKEDFAFLRLFSSPISFQGKLYWYGDHRIIAFDPFNFANTCVIDYPQVERLYSLLENPHNYCVLGVHRGSLRVLDLPAPPLPAPWTGFRAGCNISKCILSLWELNDHKTGCDQWSLVHQVFISELVSNDYRVVQELTTKSCPDIIPVALHPSDGDCVFLWIGGLILSCNMQNREMEVVGENPGFSNPCIQLEVPWGPAPRTLLQNPLT